MLKILNKCPLCGSDIEYNALMQYSDVYRIKKNGELSTNRIRKEDVGSMECGFISCTNIKCDFVTDCELNVQGHEEISIVQNYGRYYVEENKC